MLYPLLAGKTLIEHPHGNWISTLAVSMNFVSIACFQQALDIFLTTAPLPYDPVRYSLFLQYDLKTIIV